MTSLSGSRRIINVEERADVLAALDGTNYQVRANVLELSNTGSLGNQSTYTCRCVL